MVNSCVRNKRVCFCIKRSTNIREFLLNTKWLTLIVANKYYLNISGECHLFLNIGHSILDSILEVQIRRGFEVFSTLYLNL